MADEKKEISKIKAHISAVTETGFHAVTIRLPGMEALDLDLYSVEILAAKPSKDDGGPWSWRHGFAIIDRGFNDIDGAHRQRAFVSVNTELGWALPHIPHSFTLEAASGEKIVVSKYLAGEDDAKMAEFAMFKKSINTKTAKERLAYLRTTRLEDLKGEM